MILLVFCNFEKSLKDDFGHTFLWPRRTEIRREALMKKRVLWASLLVIILGLMWIPSLREVLGAEYSLQSNYNHTYTFDVQYGDCRFSHTLYTYVPPSLYDYYQGETHILGYDGDYSKFVTPDAFESVADNIRNVTRDLPYSDEQFADAVLTLIHQIPYAIGAVTYPVETLVDNSGDCYVLSLLAASIMKAGGLDVVLLYYEDAIPSHVNVGVYLPYTPAYHSWWMTSKGFEYDNKTYWMAECTAATDWRVGDCPPTLADAKPTIIPLENCEESSPAQVSSSLDNPLVPSSISINLSPENSSLEGNEQALTISGSISPACSGKNVMMYVGQDGSSCDTFSTVTDDLGDYSLTWNFTSPGTYYITTSLSGFSNYASSDSETLTVFVGYQQPLVESEVPEYYWPGPYYAPSPAYAFQGYGNSLNQSVEEFLESNLTGTGVLLSGEFIVLEGGQTVTVSRSEETTVLESPQTIGVPGSWRMTLPRVEQTETVTESNETISNQFGFILQHDGGDNYTASVKTLNNYDVSQMTEQPGGNNTALMNVTMDTQENTWYKVVARISEDEVTTQLYDENGTLLKNFAANGAATNSSESGILMTNATVVAFKNLEAETLDHPATPVDNNQTSTNGLELWAPYNGLVMLLAVGVAAIAYVTERKRVPEKQRTEPQ
jgi:hypothetical protein